MASRQWRKKKACSGNGQPGKGYEAHGYGLRSGLPFAVPTACASRYFVTLAGAPLNETIMPANPNDLYGAFTSDWP